MARAEEIDVALQDLEARLERLRSLYEQYFIGIEKLEPVIPRQDLDRRIYALRKAQIRNTAKRFKLQTIVQRYNTLQQYWLRICREIENGTYHRHVAKAERRFGNAVAAGLGGRRRGRRRAGTEPDAPQEADKPSATEQTEQSLAALLADLDPDAVLEQTLRELSFDDDEAARELGSSTEGGASGRGAAGSEPPMSIDFEPMEPMPSAGSRPRPPPPPQRTERARPSAPEAAENTAAALGSEEASAPRVSGSMSPRRPPPRLRPTAESRTASAAPEVGSPPPGIGEARGGGTSASLGASPLVNVSSPPRAEPSPAPLRESAVTAPVPPVGARLSNAPAAPPRPPRVSKAPAVAPGARGAPATAPGASGTPASPAVREEASIAAAAPRPEPAAPAGVSAPAAARVPSQAAARAASPGPSAEPPRQELGAGEGGAAEQRAARAAARSAAARAANAHKPEGPRASTALGDQRLRELHQQLIQERERLNQRGKVELDVLGKSLRDTEAKLRRQYQNKNIEFRVVVKDGKAIVKPFVG